MTKLAIVRTEAPFPVLQPILDAISDFLFGIIDGFTRDDKRAWRRLWKRIKQMEAGEILTLEVVFPRSGAFHRRHMALEQAVFDGQERFQSFDQFRNWLKLGAGHCDWAPGPKGAVVPIPKSIAYTAMDDEPFRKFHNDVVAFLRTAHAGKALWPHLDEVGRMDMIAMILEGFEE